MTKKKKMGARIYPAHKPKDGVKFILWWCEDSWEILHSSSLDFGDVWRYKSPAPSNRLLDRADQCAKDREAQLEE